MNTLVLVLTLISAHKIEQKMSMVGAPAALSQGGDQKTTMIWEGAKLRTDNGAAATSIVDFKTDTMLMIDHPQKQYSEMKISALMEQMKGALEMMKSQAAALPPSQRKAYDDMIKQQSAPLKLEATTEKQTIAGFEATKFKIRQGDRDAGEVWYTKGIDLSDLGPYMKQYADMMKGAGGSNLGEVLAKTEHGYPMKSVLAVDMMGMQVKYVTETLTYTKVKAEAKDFAVPDGYKKVEPNAAQQPGKTTNPPGGAIPAKKN